jgi:hypothetical protein
VNPPADAAIVSLALPLFVSAGAVHGTAVALARSGEETYYLVDNAAVDGPPLWVHESVIEKCLVRPVGQ